MANGNEDAITTPEGDSRDLGFGSVVARERKRLLNRDGSFNTQRVGLKFWESHSLYHTLLTMSWVRFFLLVVLFYFLANGFFGILYFAAGPDAISDGHGHTSAAAILHDFFFSVQTFGTIGYGHIFPVTTTANLIVAVESLVGLMSFAVVSGLVFARFSRPSAKIEFSEHAVMAPYNGKSAFMFRIANVRSSEMIEVQARVVLGMFTTTASGNTTRTFRQLNLERTRVAFLPLSWTIVHPIDEDSPLYGFSPEQFREHGVEFLVLLTGIDETFSTTVHARMSYTSDEIEWNARFSDIFGRSEDAEMLTVDISRIHAIDPIT